MRWAVMFVVVFIGAFCNKVIGQPSLQVLNDSLALLIPSATSDSQRVYLHYEIARNYARLDPQKAVEYYEMTLSLCDSILEIEPSEALAMEQGRVHASLGVTHYLEGNYPAAIQAEMTAIDVFEKYQVPESIGKCYVVIGAIYSHQKLPQDALKFHRKALEASTAIGDSTSMALALNNMGIAYFDQDSLEQAMQLYQRALSVYEQQGNERGMGVTLINMGSVRKEQNQLPEAADYFRRSLHLRKRIGDRQGLIFSYARLGNTLMSLDSVDAALSNGLQSIALANELQFLRGKRDAHELLSMAYYQKGDYHKAYDHRLLYQTMEDSMSSEESIKRVADAESRFKYKQRQMVDSVRNVAAQKALQTEIELKDAQARQQRLTVVALVVGIGLTILLVILSFVRYQKSKRQSQKIEEQKKQVEAALVELTKRDQEKELLLKEIHHRVKNNLQVVSSLLELQAKKADETTQTAFADGQSRVKAMALIHEKLYRNEDIASIDFAEYAEQLTKQISSLFKTKSVEVNIEGNGNQFDIDTAVPLGLILNELVTNAFKYAFSETGGLLSIEVRSSDDQFYVLTVKDNGSGLPVEFDVKKATSLGIRLVSRLSRQLYGTAEFRNNGGAEFAVTFKDTLQRKQVA